MADLVELRLFGGDGPGPYDSSGGQHCNLAKLLFDPYKGGVSWSQAVFSLLVRARSGGTNADSGGGPPWSAGAGVHDQGGRSRHADADPGQAA
jgi:hypothetical protein